MVPISRAHGGGANFIFMGAGIFLKMCVCLFKIFALLGCLLRKEAWPWAGSELSGVALYFAIGTTERLHELSVTPPPAKKITKLIRPTFFPVITDFRLPDFLETGQN